MPADGRRKKLLIGVRDAIKAANGGADYFNNLSQAGTCELGKISDPSALGTRNVVTIRIIDGSEQDVVEGGNNYIANLQILAMVYVRDSAATLVERMSDVLADINLALGRNAALGGSSTTMRIGSIDAVDYTTEVAFTTVRIATTYDYIAGVDR